MLAEVGVHLVRVIVWHGMPGSELSHADAVSQLSYMTTQQKEKSDIIFRFTCVDKFPVTSNISENRQARILSCPGCTTLS